MKLVLILRSVVLLAIVTLAACGGAAATKPLTTTARIVASAEVNPNAQGRPSPVHLRVFQLRDDAVFMNAEFGSLLENEEQTLGAALVQRFDMDLSPGDERELVLNIAPEARVIGVVAELANYRNAQWRAVGRVPTKKKEQVLIRLERNQTSILVGQ